MAELSRQTIIARLEAPGLTVETRPPARIWLASGAGLAPNTTLGEDPIALWLTPNRRLIVAETDRPPPAADFVSDVTDGFVRIAITGPRTDDLLAMATSLDPATLAEGHCAQTLWAGVKTLLHRPGALHLYVERPLAPWRLDWFRQAMTAFAKG